MKTFDCTVIYARPSHWGGIESKRWQCRIHAIDESAAESIAPLLVADKTYLYTIMVEVEVTVIL